MTKKELKFYLKIYPLISSAISQNLSCKEIILYGRKKKINIPPWLHKINDIFTKIQISEKGIVEQILECAYKSGEDDKRVILKLPITESGYYRLKRQIEEKIYELYILEGDVTHDEILRNKLLY